MLLGGIAAFFGKLSRSLLQDLRRFYFARRRNVRVDFSLAAKWRAKNKTMRHQRELLLSSLRQAIQLADTKAKLPVFYVIITSFQTHLVTRPLSIAFVCTLNELLIFIWQLSRALFSAAFATRRRVNCKGEPTMPQKCILFQSMKKPLVLS